MPPGLGSTSYKSCTEEAYVLPPHGQRPTPTMSPTSWPLWEEWGRREEGLLPTLTMITLCAVLPCLRLNLHLLIHVQMCTHVQVHTYLHGMCPNAAHTRLQGLGKKATGVPLHPGSPLCHISYWLPSSGVGMRRECRTCLQVSALLATCFSEQAGNIPKDEEYHRPTPQEIASNAGGAPSSD